MTRHRIEELAGWTARPEVHRRLLGSYRGPYALGVTRVPPDESGEPALLVRVVGEDVARTVPTSIEIDGEQVRVVVDGTFQPPARQ